MGAQTARKLLLLSLLYFVQGMPFGFQAATLPVLLRQQGWSLPAVGLVGAVSLPWMLKALWAPLVDRFWSARYGRRKSWIVPLQMLLAASCCAAAVSAHDLRLVIGCVALMNLFAATQDIAVDGLAVDLLAEGELGHGNAIQVVGYKLGMIAGSATLFWLATEAGVGLPGVFWGMACLIMLVCGALALWDEPPPRTSAPPVAAADPTGEREPAVGPPTMGRVLRALSRAFATREALLLVAFIATYRIGESCVDAMWKPYLVDRGHRAEEILSWVGTWGTVAGLLGSFAGGWLVLRLGLWRALALTATLRCAPLLAEAVVAAVDHPSAQVIIDVTILEHATSGLLTTATFAFMMSRVDRSIGATHYTALAAIEVMGKSPGIWASGVLAERFGYAALFFGGTVASLLPLALLLPLRPRSDDRPATAPIAD